MWQIITGIVSLLILYLWTTKRSEISLVLNDQGNNQLNDFVQLKPDTLLEYIIWINNYFKWSDITNDFTNHGLYSVEFPLKQVSNSEFRRWIKNGSIEINGERPRDINYKIEYPIKSLVLHPSGKRKCTLL